MYGYDYRHFMALLAKNSPLFFENPNLDFTKNRAEGAILIGDAFEYLAQHFGAVSGNSKEKFYTPGDGSAMFETLIIRQSEKSKCPK